MSTRKLVALEHVSLDGFLAGPNGELEWIRGVDDDELWNYVSPITAAADTAVFGRVTYGIMAGYWPTAGAGPDATQHDIDHSRWLNGATKLIVSKSLESAPWGASDVAQLVRDADDIARLKAQPGANMLIIGSASVVRECTRLGLIDEYWIKLNPILLGGGTPLFPTRDTRLDLQLVDSR